MATDFHRAQLSDFLKSCRARLSPGDVGLPDTGRRRTPGLRREDVAVLSGVSVTWYTWLEQGRDVRMSERMLDAISTSLRLSREERDYLFSLAQRRPPRREISPSVEVPGSVSRMIEALDVPALVMTMRWDVVGWNDMVTHTFRDYSTLAPSQRNLVRILLTWPEYQANAEEYDAIARRVLSKLRVDYSQAAGDPAFDALIAEMLEACPKFRKLWASTEISTRSEGLHVWRHPKVGEIEFEHTSYVIEGAPTLRLIVFVPGTTESAARLNEIARLAKEMPASGNGDAEPRPSAVTSGAA
jgi:hypothetical protein